MRIISGILKGRLISFLKNSNTRPLKDSVRENIFNIILHSNIIKTKIKNSNILDLYSGVGSFGIECISREAKNVTFVENNKTAIDILRENLKIFYSLNNKFIFFSKINDFLKKINKNENFNIIFFDPPYASSEYKEDLKYIGENKIYAKKHIIILHRESKNEDDVSKIIRILFTKVRICIFY